MRIFVTGASGWIGSAVTAELLARGHEVVGLARSVDSAARISAAGAVAHRGALDDLDSLRSGARGSDGVVHLGFVHDFADYAAAGRTERAAVTAMLETLEGTGRPFVIASGLAGLASGRPVTEDDATTHTTAESMRGGGEHLALSYAERGVRSIAARFAPTVHGIGDHGFTAELARVARQRGVSAYVGDGANRWAAVHREDAARLVALGVEGAPSGTRMHAVGEEGILARDIAAALGRWLDLPVASVAPEDAAEHFGWIGRFFAADMPASSALTRERLGWAPTGPTLFEDIEAGGYPA